MSIEDKPTILIVDDDLFVSQITQQVLANHYQVDHAADGQAALDYIEKKIPDLVLLDVSMPGLGGYEVCRRLRGDLNQEDLPIIFLSGMVGESERLAGYEAGGDDFLSKPASAGELLFKVDRTLKSYAERRRLNAELHHTFATAMTALTTASEIGNVLNFLRASFNCQNYESLCQEIINTLDQYGLEGSVQIRGSQGTLSMSSHGLCTPLEESVLNHLFGHGRLFEFSACLSCSYPHITLIIKNLDRDDTEKRGRIRDNIALLVEGADVRIIALDRDNLLKAKNEAMSSLIASTTAALKDIEQQQHKQLLECDQIFQDLQQTFNMKLITLGLTETQEEDLAQMIQDAAQRALDVYDAGLSTEAYMDRILKQLATQA